MRRRVLEAAEASQLCSDSIVAPEVARSCSCFRKADTFSPEWWCGGAHPFLPLVVLRKASRLCCEYVLLLGAVCVGFCFVTLVLRGS